MKKKHLKWIGCFAATLSILSASPLRADLTFIDIPGTGYGEVGGTDWSIGEYNTIILPHPATTVTAEWQNPHEHIIASGSLPNGGLYETSSVVKLYNIAGTDWLTPFTYQRDMVSKVNWFWYSADSALGGMGVMDSIFLVNEAVLTEVARSERLFYEFTLAHAINYNAFLPDEFWRKSRKFQHFKIGEFVAASVDGGGPDSGGWHQVSSFGQANGRTTRMVPVPPIVLAIYKDGEIQQLESTAPSCGAYLDVNPDFPPAHAWAQFDLIGVIDPNGAAPWAGLEEYYEPDAGSEVLDSSGPTRDPHFYGPGAGMGLMYSGQTISAFLNEHSFNTTSGELIGEIVIFPVLPYFPTWNESYTVHELDTLHDYAFQVAMQLGTPTRIPFYASESTIAPPFLNAPDSTLNVAADASLALNTVSVEAHPEDEGPLTVHLKARAGTITLADTCFLDSITWNGPSEVTLIGSESCLNNFLSSMVYHPGTWVGVDFIEVSVRADSWDDSVSQLILVNVTPSTSGLVARWSAEDNGNDSVGTHHGTLSGVTFETGVNGQAFQFAPTGTRVSVPDSTDFHLTQSLSIEGWFNTADGLGKIIERGDTRAGFDPFTVDLYGSGGNLSFRIADAQDQSAAVEAPIQKNVWVHFVATLDDTTGDMRLYVNGLLAGSTVTDIRPLGALDPNLSRGLVIGNTVVQNFNFNGRIDEISLYNRCLSASEAQSIYYNTLAQFNDADHDFLPDDWEVSHFGNTVPAPAGDADNDGLLNVQEFKLFFKPMDADMDDDGLTDGEEFLICKTLVKNADTDGDGLTDGEEVFYYGSNPLSLISDDSGLTDWWQVHYFGEIHIDPLADSADNDGLSNRREFELGTNPTVADTDGDGLSDGVEVNLCGTNPLSSDAPNNYHSGNTDSNGNGFAIAWELHYFGNQHIYRDEDAEYDDLLNWEEYDAGTDPGNIDTDGDGLGDGEEIKIWGTDPLDPNSP